MTNPLISFWKNYYYSVSPEIRLIFIGILAVLVICTILFSVYQKISRKTIAKELLLRTNSWWIIAIGFWLLVTGPLMLATLLVAYVSFLALREMLSISPLRTADRTGLFVAYWAVPIQYYFVFINSHTLFLIFVPIIMYVTVPVVLVMSGKMDRVGRSMSIIPAILMLTVFLLSHVIMILQFNDVTINLSGHKLVVFLIVLTAFNDVFQFTWGTLLGKHKILPEVSPNKTWEGFIGGVLTTALLGYFIRFLTPFQGFDAFLISLGLGVFGFLGDALISAIKRDLKVKDTSDLIPGHGGAMDRLDSLLFTAPVLYYSVYLIFIDT
ncbi:MAG: phosphatidate cytidylyltransferase [Cyclobacteriaceae bacterium]